jgi:UDP-N-acetylglucosamine 2-epimerase (non-hydrolysing)
VSQLLVVVGARPNFVKAASIVDAARRARLSCVLVHTGQHHDADLSDVFFEDLALPEPDYHLGVGSGSHALQTAKIMLAFEGALQEIRPAIVVVVGDVNSTLACSLVAAKEQYPVAHVEAGLRCYDPTMPEEINRRLCDHLSSFLFATCRDAVDNLVREGIDRRRIFFVGNTMIDTLVRFREAARARQTAARLGLANRRFALATLHRPPNVDDWLALESLLSALGELSRILPVVLPLHPRTRARIDAAGLGRLLDSLPRLVVVPPLGYLDFVSLMGDASLVLSDSGGVQEETTVLGVPCLTLRETTERPVTVTQGTNRVIGTNPHRIVEAAVDALAMRFSGHMLPELWDGRAGDRIVERLRDELISTLPTAVAANAG